MELIKEFVFMYTVIFVLHENTRSVHAGLGQQKLLDKLFTDYEILNRPVKNDSHAVIIQMQFYLRQVMDINEKKQIMRSSIWLNLQWQDEGIGWDVSEYHNVSKIIVPYTKIWAPDILLWNSATQEFDATFKTNLEISHDGTINWVPPALFTSTCSIDITWFPFDLQACTLKFSSWTYEPRRLDIKSISEEVDVSAYQRNGEWDLEDAYCQRNIVVYACCPDDPWVDITVTIKLRRRVLYYMFNIIIPSVVISCIGLLTFALPCESGEKVTMSVTILLSLAFFMTMVAETLPSTSEAIPFLGVYFGSLMLLCATSLVVTVFVGSIHHRKPEMCPVPKWIHKWFSCRLAVFFRMLPPNHPIITCNAQFPLHDKKPIANYNCHDSVSLRYRGSEHASPSNGTSFLNGAPPNYQSNANDMKSVTLITSADDKSPILPPASWSKRFNHTAKTDLDQKEMLLSQRLPSSPSYQNTSLQPEQGHYKNITAKTTTLLLIEDANEILRGLQVITKHIAETARLNEIRREWRLAASVVDRIFMYISIGLFLVFNFLMAILAPNTPLSVISIY